MSYTLFQSLTQLENHVFPATESIKQLIQTIARDVVRFRRNTQISYHFVARATHVCDEINDLIRKVDENDDWDSYDKFTEAIDILEELLLDSTVTIQDEVQRHFGGERDIDGYIASATNWENNREKLRSFLTKLRPNSEIWNLLLLDDDEDAEIIEAGKHDDASFLLELHQAIKGHSFRKAAEGTVPQLIESVNDRLADLYALAQGEVLENDLTIFTTQTAMLVFGIMDLSMNPSADKNSIHHLKLGPVWVEAHRLLDHFCDITEGALHSDITTNMMTSATLSYTQLMKQVGKIRQPYHAQALALISLCRSLARHYEDLTKEQRTATNVEPLEDACKKTLAALQLAASSVSMLRSFDMNTPENARVHEEFSAARAKIQDCCSHFGLTSHWDRFERTFQQAVEKDRSRTAQLREILTARPLRSPNDTSNLVRVNVKVRDRDPAGDIIRSFSLDVEPETRLRALRWHISKALDQQESARRGSQDGESLVQCRVHVAIEEITSSRDCELVLVLA
ncbi:hypothetical protein BGW80DRAFT_1307122 [Lactifluus volemus]|nr:hypothetical protein BGW80DRAFT_1307122 [Lactifluus volemus]